MAEVVSGIGHTCEDCFFANQILTYEGQSGIECRNIRNLVGNAVINRDKILVQLRKKTETACVHFVPKEGVTD